MCIACLSLRTQKLLIAEYTHFFLLGSATTTPPPPPEIAVFYGEKNDFFDESTDIFVLSFKKRFFDESTDIFVLSLATTPPPPPPTLDSRYFARDE